MKLFEIGESYIRLNQETVHYLLNQNGGATLGRIRLFIANLFNHRYYPAPDIFGMLRYADESHHELIVNIIEFMGTKYGDACFLLIDDLALRIIEKYSMDEKYAKEED